MTSTPALATRAVSGFGTSTSSGPRSASRRGSRTSSSRRTGLIIPANAIGAVARRRVRARCLGAHDPDRRAARARRPAERRRRVLPAQRDPGTGLSRHRRPACGHGLGRGGAHRRSRSWAAPAPPGATVTAGPAPSGSRSSPRRLIAEGIVFAACASLGPCRPAPHRSGRLPARDRGRSSGLRCRGLLRSGRAAARLRWRRSRSPSAAAVAIGPVTSILRALADRF